MDRITSTRRVSLRAIWLTKDVFASIVRVALFASACAVSRTAAPRSSVRSAFGTVSRLTSKRLDRDQGLTLAPGGRHSTRS